MTTKHNQKEIMPLIFDTYIAVIKNSVGSRLFQNLYAKVNGKKVDILHNGELSCAFYVSSILALFKFIKEVHGTVDSTIKDLKEFGWRKINKPRVGCVLVWEKAGFGNNDVHKHIGFFVGKNKAVSNSTKLSYPVAHSWNFNTKRRVDMILWNPSIDSKKQ